MIDFVVQSELDRKKFSELRVSEAEIADDHYDYSKVVVRKPWGYEYLIYQNDTVAVWVLYLKRGAQTSMHCHPHKKTSLIVLEGEVECTSLEKSWQRKAGDGLLIEKGVFHQSRAVSEAGAFIMEIETPINKRDLVRLADLYGREHKGYETAESHSLNTQNYNYLSLQGLAALHNQKKRFGRCSLTFRKASDLSLAEEISGSHDDDVISVIRGSFVDAAGGSVLKVGDTISAKELRRTPSLCQQRGAEILVVKRIDADIKVSDYISRFLKMHSLSTVFVVPGDANVHLLDSVGREEGLRYIASQSETGASLGAEGYAKTANHPGVLIISSGGSGPRSLAGVANAWIDSTPLLVISGQARSDQCQGQVRQLGNKSLNVVDLAARVTKYAATITDPLTVSYHLERALYEATQGRPGPVWLDIPIDILGSVVDESEMQRFEQPKIPPARTPSAVSQVVEMLQGAKRPVLLAGNGIAIGGASEAFLRLIDKLQIPVVTSRRAAALIPEDHPLYVGRPGTYGQRRANFIIQNADCILSIGSRLSIPLIGRNTESFGRAAKKIVVDIDPQELSKETVTPDLAIEESSKDFIENLLLEDFTPPSYQDWWERCRQWKKDFPVLQEGYAHSKGINPYLFLRALSEKLAKDDTVVIDGGAVMHCAMQVFAFKEGQSFISSTGLELPGFAIAGAIGAGVAKLGKRIYCVCEDRGFQSGIPELQTISDNRLPIVIFVLKSGGHSTVRKIQKDFFGGRYVGTDTAILFGSPDFSSIGAAYGLDVIEIEDPSSFKKQLDTVLSQNKPTLVSVAIDSEQELVPRMGFVVKDDGKWVAKPLEDMYPFLDRETLRRNMIIDILEDN